MQDGEQQPLFLRQSLSLMAGSHFPSTDNGLSVLTVQTTLSPILNTHTLAQTRPRAHVSRYMGTNQCHFHFYIHRNTHRRARIHTLTAKEGKKQQYQWCDTILRMPGQSWSVAHAFDVNPEHGHVTNADNKLHPVPLWSLKPYACFNRGNKIVYVCV